MLHLLQKKYLPIGLDIGSHAVRGIQLCQSANGLRVHAALEVSTPMVPSEVPGNDPDDQRILQQVTSLFQRAGFVGRDVVLHCPVTYLDMRPISLPAGPEGLSREIIISAIKMQMADKMSCDPEQAVFDYSVLGHDPAQNILSVMAFTADGHWCRDRIRLLSKIKLHCERVDAIPCVLTRLRQFTCVEDVGSGELSLPERTAEVEKPHARSSCNALTAIINMGSSFSTMIVSNAQGPMMCRKFNLSGREITENLQSRLMLEPQHAETLKNTYGLTAKNRPILFDWAVTDDETPGHGDAVCLASGTSNVSTMTQQGHGGGSREIAKSVSAVLRSMMQDFTEGIIRTLNYAITEYRGGQLDRVLLCGTASRVPGLSEFLGEQFEFPVEVLSHRLLDDLQQWLLPSQAHPGRWTTALGLALGSEDGQ